MRRKITDFYLNVTIKKCLTLVRTWGWELPSNIHWRVNDSHKNAGMVDYDKNMVILGSFLKDESPQILTTIILHELAHLSVYHSHHVTGHGKYWKQLVEQANTETNLNIRSTVSITELPVLYTKYYDHD